MKRSSSFLALAVGLALSAAAFAVDVVKETAATVFRCAECVFKAVVFGPSMAAADTESQAQAEPRVTLTRAVRFTQRMLKRERPRITPDWRMCPSI